MLIEKLRGAATFKGCVQSFISGWEFILLTKLEDTNRNQVRHAEYAGLHFWALNQTSYQALRYEVQTGIKTAVVKN
jgi:hypothetical protein